MSSAGPSGAPTRILFDRVVQRFRLIRERPDTLREAFAHAFTKRVSYTDFEALKGVSFQIRSGESVGLLGRNGSGKSTILRIIAGVYRPSAGTVRVDGKVAALIELGAGFHPDLTGRENVILNGLLLGLSKREIAAREDRILDFAELGDFIDSPVKQYSTGMFMRLAFSVATEVDPDILLMDEILAVGDAGFQQKCLARVNSFLGGGKTVVMVSHSAATVRNLCQRAIWIHDGVMRMDGPVDEVSAVYEGAVQQPVEP